MSYNLYTSAARSVIWGNGTGGTQLVSDNVTLFSGSLIRNYTTYGRIPVGQDRAAGSYADSIIVTVEY